MPHAKRRHRIVLLVWSALSLAAAAAAPLPTQQEILDSYAAKDYAKTVQSLSRVLSLKGKAAEPYNRHELLRIRGESQLRLKALPSAAQAFDEASKVAPDGKETATDIATNLLFKRSKPDLTYQPRGKDAQDKTKSTPAVPIVEADDRQKAIKLLYQDEMATVAPKVKAAEQGKSLPPIMQVVPSIRDVRWLELAATGSDGTTKGMSHDMLATAKRLTESSVKSMKESTDDIERLAMRVNTTRVPVNDPKTGKVIRFDTKYRYEGPDNKQFATLRDTLATCKKLHQICDEMGGTLGETGKEFDAAKAETEQIGNKANNLLNRNWRETFDTDPGTKSR